MAEPWIRVHANLIDRPVVMRAVEHLRITDHAAVGLLVTFWGSVSRHVVGGAVGEATDAQLEKWARWTGKRGAFAKFIREHHLDADGRPNEWDDYNGALEHRRANERERKARERARTVGVTSRGRSAGSHADVTRTGGVTVQPARAVRNETIRVTTPPPPPLARGESAEPEPAVEPWTPPSETAAVQTALAERLPSAADRTALAQLVEFVPNPPTWLAELTASLDGMAGHAHVTPEQAGQAIRDFVGNGAAKEPNLRKFRRYLEQAANGAEGRQQPIAGTIPAPMTNGRRAPDVPASRGKAALVVAQIRALAETHQQPGQVATRFIRRTSVAALGDDVLRAYDAVGGAERVLDATGDKLSFVVRDFADALAAVEADHVTA